ncbi:hypothetical protein [Natronospirillum operosum]|nr:hypothetical protein [Natronospirillum operosum]
MAKALPKLLTRRQESHRLISWLARLQVRHEAWKDARAVNKALKRARKAH